MDKRDYANGWAKDPRTRYYIDPRKIVWATEGANAGVERAEALLEGRDGQATLAGEGGCVLRSAGGESAGLLLDFGTELHGGIQLCVWFEKSRKKTVRMRVRFGESAMEAMNELGGERNAGNDHAVRDQIVEACSFLGMTEIGNSGFRFVRIDLLEQECEVELKSVRAVCLLRDIEYKGRFRCSDPLLERIWQTGAYTVHLNMQEYLWDGIKRDRLVWIGDMHPEVAALGAVFGHNEVVPKSLDLIRDNTPLPGWMNSIPSYSVWWILIHRDWYWVHKDMAYLRGQRTYLLELLAMLAAGIGDDGRFDDPKPFLDWPTSSNDAGVRAGVHALLVSAMAAGAELCGALEEAEAAERCRAAERKLRRHVPDHGNSKQAAALMALAGLLDPEAANRDVLAIDGPRNISTFLGYYVLKARGEAGDILGSLDCIREYWGGMLKLGATTFWEDFDIDWMDNAARIDELTPPGKTDVHGQYGQYCYKGYRHSLCHGWAAGPTAWLSEYVLGIRIKEAGGALIEVKPRLGDLDWAEGSLPTPYGTVSVRHDRRSDGTVDSKIDAPPGVVVLRG
ncbi:alpha-L-rhamnosidase [Paenibacillus hemerocallicola]|uniref:Alpha-L-rhamnosidase n=1 Tax=Paenibacillus hemerocallicola TaxID=1172614 RepID=A0A5C4SXW1_9BACL|nr:alpha-L-rhamnosidase C-terminal domain-containing protein [Paenibacillus hemerocallicola]TNJ60671.1 alpha-L-rhamnosidase [Paenibacillus hemerocallicola]